MVLPSIHYLTCLFLVRRMLEPIPAGCQSSKGHTQHSLTHYTLMTKYIFTTKNLFCQHQNRGLPLEEFEWISCLSKYFWGRQWKHCFQYNRGQFQWRDPILYRWSSKYSQNIVLLWSMRISKEPACFWTIHTIWNSRMAFDLSPNILFWKTA